MSSSSSNPKPSADPPITLSLTPPCATLTLSNPRRGNSLNPSMQSLLLSHLSSLESNPLVHFVVLTAVGANFCTGMDLGAAQTAGGEGGRGVDDVFDAGRSFFEGVERFPKPIIGLANGPCYGGGIGLFFLCDIRLCPSNLTFTLSEVRRGLIPALISPTIIREWGVGLAREAMLTARPVRASELETLGAVKTFDDAQDKGGQKSLEDMIGWMKRNGPNAMRRTKELVRSQATTSLTKMPRDLASSSQSGQEAAHAGALKALQDGFKEMMAPSEEAMLGLSTFAQFKGKKDPDWLEFYKDKQEEEGVEAKSKL